MSIQPSQCRIFYHSSLTSITWISPAQTLQGLSQMMLVNRANITSLIDRMEKADLVVRTPVPGDRRYNAIKLTEHGREVLLEVEERYLAAVAMVMSPLSKEEQDQLMNMLERLRENLP